MVATQTGSLAGTGAVLGMLHVLTGPDHLSAVATLGSNAPPLQALWLGVRWGIGHSFGLLVVGAIFIALTVDDSDSAVIEIPHAVSKFFECLVGVFMLALGAYGLRRAKMIRPKAADASDDDADLLEPLDDGVYMKDMENNSSNNPYEEDVADAELAIGCDDDENDGTDSTNDALPIDGVAPGADSLDDSSDDKQDESPPPQCCCSRYIQKLSTGTVSLLAGIIHGLAGPGGVLGVIPAVQLHDWRLAAIYLSCFCTLTIITMGAFALVYGALSSQVGVNQHRQYLIQLLSACLSVLIGFLWLLLLGLDKLDVVFP